METEEVSEELVTPESIQQEEISTPTPTQPVVTSPSISTDGRDLYLSVLRDKEAEIKRLNDRLNAPPPVAPKVVTPEDNQRFFSEPVSAVKDLVSSELERQLAPLLKFVGGMQQTTAYDNLKNQIKANPRLAKVLQENETYVDQLMKGADPTESNITAAILQIAGARAAGLLDDQIPVTAPVQNPPVPVINQTPQNPVSMTNPPHLRPSSPPAPRENNAPKLRELTENERRLCREWNMTPAEYLKGQEGDSIVMEPDVTTNPAKKTKEQA
jgi:hypothetical protein